MTTTSKPMQRSDLYRGDNVARREPEPTDPMEWCDCGHTWSWHTDNPATPCLGDGDDGRCECQGFVPEVT